MNDADPALFPLPARPVRPGRRRRELDADIKHALADGARLPRAGIAALRDLAESIDAIVRAERERDEPGKLAWHLATLNREFRATYAMTFGEHGADDDPFARADTGPMVGPAEPAAPLGTPPALDTA